MRLSFKHNNNKGDDTEEREDNFRRGQIAESRGTVKAQHWFLILKGSFKFSERSLKDILCQIIDMFEYYKF